MPYYFPSPKTDDPWTIPASCDTHAFRYDFTADYVKVGSTLFRPVNSTSAFINTDFRNDYLTVPFAHIDAVAKAFDGVYNRTTGLYEVKCDAKLSSLIISFRSQQLTVASESLISDIPNDNGTCELRIYSFYGITEWTFGSALARSYCQVFDLDKKQVGFGKVKSK